ncbi:MAG: ABC transporter substrate-binding protein [Ignavibacteriales bacterium]|nr:MAG: ABC transporter substrate-binding protein [Ignavibacteriales bacterium]
MVNKLARVKLKNVVKFIVILIGLSLLFSSCGEGSSGTDGETKEIVFWHSFVSSTVPALNALIADFESIHPNIKVKAQYIPTGDALVQKLITSIQSKTAPDISWLHAHFIEDLVEANAIYKMDHFINGENGLEEGTLEDIYPALLQYASWRGTLYTIPMEATNLALLYNKDMFRAAGLDPNHPPKNWEELQEYAEKLTFDKNGDGKFEQVGLFLPVFPAAGPLSSWMVWQFHPFLWQAGGYKIDLEQTHVMYHEEAGVQALQLWKDIYQKLRLDVFTPDYDVAFASKNLAMAMDGPWNLPRYNEILKNMDWGFAPLPAGPEKRATIVGGEYLAIFKQSKNPDEAWAFLKWIIEPEVQAKWAMTSGYLPIRRAVLEVPEFQKYLKENPNFKVFVDEMEYGQAERPIDYGGMEIMRHMADAIEKATVGKQDVRKALNEGAELSNKVLDAANAKHKN